MMKPGGGWEKIIKRGGAGKIILNRLPVLAAAASSHESLTNVPFVPIMKRNPPLCLKVNSCI
jgi:hypothetical protein